MDNNCEEILNSAGDAVIYRSANEDEESTERAIVMPHEDNNGIYVQFSFENEGTRFVQDTSNFRRNSYRHRRSRHQSYRQERRHQRSKMYRKLKSLYKLWRKTAKSLHKMECLMNQQVELVRNLQLPERPL